MASPFDRSALSGEGAAGEPTGRGRIARVLDEDPELGEGIDVEALAAARQCARAAVVRVASGEWEQSSWPASIRSGFGLLVLDGLLLRRVGMGDRVGVELLSTGDLLRPWQREDALASVARQLGWWVLAPCRLAILDVDFARRVSAFPQIAGQLTGRAMRRSRHFAVILAIVQQPKVESRLQMLFWHLADRWGTVRPDGVLVPLRLTHTVLAELVAARRPTVSSALGVLERDGQLARIPAGWVIRGSPPGEREPD